VRRSVSSLAQWVSALKYNSWALKTLQIDIQRLVFNTALAIYALTNLPDRFGRRTEGVILGGKINYFIEHNLCGLEDFQIQYGAFAWDNAWALQ